MSWVALRHPNGGKWTVSRALGEVRHALDMLEARAGKDFGELVRERRRQRGLPLPLAEKVVSVHLSLPSSAVIDLPEQAPPTEAFGAAEPEVQMHVHLAERQMADAWLRLEEEERCGATLRHLRGLEEAYLRAVQSYVAMLQSMAVAEPSER